MSDMAKKSYPITPGSLHINEEFGAGPGGQPNRNWAAAYPMSAKAIDDMDRIKEWIDKNMPLSERIGKDTVDVVLYMMQFALDVALRAGSVKATQVEVPED